MNAPDQQDGKKPFVLPRSITVAAEIGDTNDQRPTRRSDCDVAVAFVLERDARSLKSGAGLLVGLIIIGGPLKSLGDQQFGQAIG